MGIDFFTTNQHEHHELFAHILSLFVLVCEVRGKDSCRGIEL